MHHLKKFYCYFLLVSTLLVADTKETYDWYTSFYEQLSQQDIKSIRYFQIWVAPGKSSPEEILPIGGSLENFELWLESTEEFITSKDFHREIWHGDFLYEITVDKNVYQKYQSLFEKLKAKYGGSFEFNVIEEYRPQDQQSPMRIGYEQCLCGVASVCSDYWRFAHSRKEEFEINIYADIDTLSQSIKTKKGQSHEKLGLSTSNNFGIYVPFFWSQGDLHWNTDMLIFKKVAAQQYNQIQALFEDTFEKQALSFEYILKHQKNLENIGSYNEYLADLEKRLELFLVAPETQLNRYELIMSAAGPGFWLGMTQQNLAQPYWHGASDSVDNYFSWVSPDIQESYERADGILLDTLYTHDEKVKILKMIFMLYDRAYLKNQNIDWKKSLEAGFREEILKNQKILDELPPQLNFLKKNTQSFLRA